MSKLTKIQLACMAILVALCASTASAFNPSVYATKSRLANGSWVKIFIPESGMYEITYEDGNWYANWGGSEFPFGLAVEYGHNIPVAPGTYTVMFNDILGYYYFMAQ